MNQKGAQQKDEFQKSAQIPNGNQIGLANNHDQIYDI